MRTRVPLILLLALLLALGSGCSGQELPPVDIHALRDENAKIVLAIDPKLAQPLLREVFNPGGEWLRNENLPHQFLCTFSVDSATKTSCCKVFISPRGRLGKLCDDLNALARPEWLRRVLGTRFTASAQKIVAAEDRVPVDDGLLQSVLAQGAGLHSERTQLEGNHAIEVLINLDDGTALTVLPCIFPSSDFLQYNIAAGLGPISDAPIPPLAKTIQTHVGTLLHMRTIHITGDFQDEHTLKLHVAITRKDDRGGRDYTPMVPLYFFNYCPWLFSANPPTPPAWVQTQPYLKPDLQVPLTVSGDFVIDKFDLRFKVALEALSRVLGERSDKRDAGSASVDNEGPKETL